MPWQHIRICCAYKTTHLLKNTQLVEAAAIVSGVLWVSSHVDAFSRLGNLAKTPNAAASIHMCIGTAIWVQEPKLGSSGWRALG